MASFQKAKKLIGEARNIYILPAPLTEQSGTDNSPEDNQAETISSALALFYTLRKLKKNVNLIVEEIPLKFQFLIPSLDFLTYPKDFVISIQSSSAEISQARYEKDEKDLKIYLTLDKGNIKKNNVSFGFASVKPDLLITIGIKDLSPHLFTDNRGFKTFSNLPVLNIDNQAGNKNFGSANLVKSNYSLREIITNLIKSIGNNLWDKNIKICLLAKTSN